MARISAFSSVTVTDYSDVGQINLYLTSNQPTTVIYDPNGSTYTPNWSVDNLIITPVISFNGKPVSLSATGLTVNYSKREGSGTVVNLNSGEIVSGKILTVSANKLGNITRRTITYICDVIYTDASTGVSLNAQATLTYSLIDNATESRYCSISGENIFAYDSSRNLIGKTSITLKANLQNVTVVKWQYKNSSDVFVDYPKTVNTSIATDTLVVSATEQNIWLNDRTAVIKLITSDSDVTDIFSVNKIYDGAPGDATITAILSNENHTIPVNSNGTPTSWNGAETQIYIYDGGDEVTNDWTIEVTPGDGLTITYDTTTHIMTPTSLTTDVSYVEFRCIKEGYSEVIKRYSILKQYPGANGEDAVVYNLGSDSLVINRNESGVLSPTSITLTSTKNVGDGYPNNYDGRFLIKESLDGINYTISGYTSQNNEHSVVYTPTRNDIKSIQVTLYASGGFGTVLDVQTIIITSDGISGEDGADGIDSLSFFLGNDADLIPCTTEKKVTSTHTINIPFMAYQGIHRIPVSCTVGTLPSGFSVVSNTNGTALTDGLLVLRVASGSNLGGTSATYDSGEIQLTLTGTTSTNETQVATRKFTWAKAMAGATGDSAVILQLYSEDGGVIHNTKTSTVIKANAMHGSVDITNSATSITWKKYDTAYTKIPNTDNLTSITVNASDVDGNGYYMCEFVYGGKTYKAYFTVTDTSDPVQAYSYATVPQLKNGIGYSIIYTRAYQNGEEIDPIKSLRFLESNPGTVGDGFYYKVSPNSADKLSNVVLMEYKNKAWSVSTHEDELKYEYYRVNSKGVELDTTVPYISKRVFYVDNTIVDGQCQFRCKVTSKS